MNEINLVKSSVIFPFIKEILALGKHVRITVTGGSMYPFLRENIDSVELCQRAMSQIRRGDIVLILRENNDYVLHRVVKKRDNSFYIAGDAQQWIEGPIYPNQLIAAVSTVWRKTQKIECTSIYWKIPSYLWLRAFHFRYLIIKTYANLRKLA